MENRKIYVKTWEDLASEKSMIFLAGPRQAGKTTLAGIISKKFSNNLYFNYDIAEDRAQLINNPSFFTETARTDSSNPLVIFDEIHKYKNWKNYLKGIYDRFHDEFQFLISGSGRLDLYRRGADSLAGRYFMFYLWPFTLAELGKANVDFYQFMKNPLDINMQGKKRLSEIWRSLSVLSGFPEPYLSGRETNYRRWTNTYSRQLIREDIRDLTEIKSITDIETLYILLSSRIGAPLSVPSLSRDMKVSYNTIQSWLSILETFFMIFSINAWTKKISRAIQKERKIYLWDSPRIKNEAARFENMVALELYRAISSWNDMGYGSFSLHFIKNKEQQEVDFIIANDNKPVLLIEAKISENLPSAPLKKFQDALTVPAIQLNNREDEFRIIPNGSNKILIAPACQWLAGLP